MNTNRIKYLLVVIACSCPTLYLQAQPKTYTEESEIEVILVTARRIEERLLDIPAVVTSLSGEQLEMRGAADVSAAARQVGSVVDLVDLERVEIVRGPKGTLYASYAEEIEIMECTNIVMA